MKLSTQAFWGVIIAGLITVTTTATAQVSAEVNCAQGNTLARALRVAQPGDTLRILGECSEFVTITTDRLTLDGGGSAIIDGGGGGAAVITIDGARGILIRGLTVRNSTDGILITRAAGVELESVVAEDNTDDGLNIVENSTARVFDSTAQRNGSNGIELTQSSNLTLQGSIISRDNGFHGMSFFGAASVVFTNAMVEITGNTQNGINLITNSGLSIRSGSSVTVESNEDGMQIGNSANLSLSRSSSITASLNRRFGLFVLNTSSAFIFGTINITGSGASGIQVTRTSALELGGLSNLTSESNTNNGLSITSLSVGVAFGDTTVSLLNNGASNLFVQDGSQWQALGTVNIPSSPASLLSREDVDGLSTDGESRDEERRGAINK